MLGMVPLVRLNKEAQGMTSPGCHAACQPPQSSWHVCAEEYGPLLTFLEAMSKKGLNLNRASTAPMSSWLPGALGAAVLCGTGVSKHGLLETCVCELGSSSSFYPCLFLHKLSGMAQLAPAQLMQESADAPEVWSPCCHSSQLTVPPWQP